MKNVSKKLFKDLKNTLQKLWLWLVVSSVNPTQTSVTVKGIMLASVPKIVIIAQLFGVDVPPSAALDIVDTLSELLGTILAIVGMARKLANTTVTQPPQTPNYPEI